MLQALEGYGASCKRISRAGEEEDCNKDPSATLGMTIRGRDSFTKARDRVPRRGTIRHSGMKAYVR